jgi:hypothetical protein
MKKQFLQDHREAQASAQGYKKTLRLVMLPTTLAQRVQASGTGRKP